MGDAEGGLPRICASLRGRGAEPMEWFLLTHKQFAMENEENEFKAGFRACLNQTGMKLI